MALAFVKSNAATEDTDDTAVTVQLTTVTAGNLIVLWIKFEGDANNNATCSASDGTSSFTARPVNHNDGVDDLHGCFLYLLASVASGTVTYTVTISESVPFKVVHAREYSYTGTLSFDVADETAEGATSPATVGPSGAITTTGTDEVVIGGIAFYQSTGIDTSTIGGVAAANEVGTGTSGFTSHRILTATMTSGTFVANVGADNDWVASIISFKAAAGGGGRTTKNTRSAPLGVEVGMNWRGQA
jgi:hypothetical protein